MKAYLKNYRQAPRKVRMVTNLIKGKDVARALLILDTTPKRATRQLKGLVQSALANAKNNDGTSSMEGLFIQEIRVDKGITMHRYMPKAQGRATRFDKHSSNVILKLGTREKKQEPNKTAVSSEKKTKIISKASKPKKALKAKS